MPVGRKLTIESSVASTPGWRDVKVVEVRSTAVGGYSLVLASVEDGEIICASVSPRIVPLVRSVLRGRIVEKRTCAVFVDKFGVVLAWAGIGERPKRSKWDRGGNW